MTPATAEPLDRSAIPVVDIGPLRDGTGGQGVAEGLHCASRDVGFIYIRNHGIEERLLAEARAEAYAFFRAPEQQKAQVRINAAHRGWLGQGGARMRDDAKPDLKESFLWGYEATDGVTTDGHPLRGVNQWPAFRPSLQGAAMAYFEAAHDVAHSLMKGFALGLDKPADFFLGSPVPPLSRASFVYYPPQAADTQDDHFGVAPHTDFGMLTVLAQDDVGGLQVQDAAGRWIAAEPIAGSLIVNVGDLLARWTNDAYRSTPHRVINTSGRERLSLVLAYDPAPQTLVDPRQVFGAEVETDYEPITCGDYLTWRFGKAFAYRNEA